MVDVRPPGWGTAVGIGPALGPGVPSWDTDEALSDAQASVGGLWWVGVEPDPPVTWILESVGTGRDAGGHWPAPVTEPTVAMLVCWATVRSMSTAVDAASAHARAEAHTSAGLAGVVLVTMPGRVPREVKRMREHLATLVPRVWTIPWHPSWTVEFDASVPDEQEAPRIAQLRRDVAAVLAAHDLPAAAVAELDIADADADAAPIESTNEPANETLEDEPGVVGSLGEVAVGSPVTHDAIAGAAEDEVDDAGMTVATGSSGPMRGGVVAQAWAGPAVLATLLVLGLVVSVVVGVALLRSGSDTPTRPVAKQGTPSASSTAASSPTPSSPSASPTPKSLPPLGVVARAGTGQIVFRIRVPKRPVWVTVDVDPAARGAKSVRKMFRITGRQSHQTTITGLPAGKARWVVSSRGSRRAEGAVKVRPRPSRDQPPPASSEPSRGDEPRDPPPANDPPPPPQSSPPPASSPPPGGPVDPDDPTGDPGGPTDPDARTLRQASRQPEPVPHRQETA